MRQACCLETGELFQFEPFSPDFLPLSLSLSFIPPSPEPTSHQAITLKRPEREELHSPGPKHPPTPKRGRRGNDALVTMLSVWVTGMKGCCRGQGPKMFAGDAWRAGVFPKDPAVLPDTNRGWCPRGCSRYTPRRAVSPSPRSLMSSGTRESFGKMFPRCHDSPGVQCMCGGEFCKAASASPGSPGVGISRHCGLYPLVGTIRPLAETSSETSLCLSFVPGKCLLLPRLPQWGWKPF